MLNIFSSSDHYYDFMFPSKTCKESEIPSYFQTHKSPATISWGLAEGRRLQGQRQMALLFVVIAGGGLSASALVYCIPLVM